MAGKRWGLFSLVLFGAGLVVGTAWPWGLAQTKQVRPAAAARTITPAEAARQRLVTSTDGKSSVVQIDFPGSDHPLRTSWKVVYSVSPVATKAGERENLVIHGAYFKPSPEAAEIQVLGMTHLAESLVAYSNGVRYYDIADHNNGLLPAHPGELGDHAITLTPDRKVIAEVRDTGIAWKAGHGDHFSRRGEALVLWGTIKAANYLYVAEFTFRDDGSIGCRMGSTGSNLTNGRMISHSHMHLALWRIDIDLGGSRNNKAYLVRHREPFGKPQHATYVVEPFNDGVEGFADWNDREFTILRIANPTIKNRSGHELAYDLVTYRTGTSRHFGASPDEQFTHHDYYVLPFKLRKDRRGPDEMDCTKLMQYARQGRSLKDQDLVLWHITSGHHIPRDEDLRLAGKAQRTAATLVLWSGFDLRPRDLFDGTPFYVPQSGKKD